MPECISFASVAPEGLEPRRTPSCNLVKYDFRYFFIITSKFDDFLFKFEDSSSILFKSKNKYMLMPCTAEKFFTIQLAEDVIVDTVVLANLEHYSSNFREVLLFASTKFPSTKWNHIHTYEAAYLRNFFKIKVFYFDV